MTDSTQAAPVSEPDEQPFADVVAEIMAEAQRRRDSGEYPIETLERLDAEFDRFAPLTYRRTGIDGAIRAVESAAFINIDVPTAASRKPFEFVKQNIKRSTAWYHLHVARQVTTLGIQITRPLRMLATDLESLTERVASLETQSGPLAELRTELSTNQLPPDDLDAATVTQLLGEHGGRVLVHGLTLDTVESLATGGLDVFAVARLERTDEGGSAPLVDVRFGEIGAHLAGLGEGVLGGVVLAGPAVNLRSVDERLGLVTSALNALRPGGRLVIIGAHASDWAELLGEVAADLAPGRPLSAPTWTAILHALGARSTRDASDDRRVIVVGSAS